MSRGGAAIPYIANTWSADLLQAHESYGGKANHRMDEIRRKKLLTLNSFRDIRCPSVHHNLEPLGQALPEVLPSLADNPVGLAATDCA